MLFSNKIVKEIKPQFIKKGISLYSLKTIHIILNESLYNKFVISKDIYILLKIKDYKNIKPSIPKNDDKLINNMKELIDFLIYECKLKKDNKYRIIIYGENLLIIGNNEQLITYKKKILYIRINEAIKKISKIKINLNKCKSVESLNNNNTENNNKINLNKDKNRNIKQLLNQTNFNSKRTLSTFYNQLPSQRTLLKNQIKRKINSENSSKNNSLDFTTNKNPKMLNKSVSTDFIIPKIKINKSYLNKSIEINSSFKNNNYSNSFPIRGKYQISKLNKRNNSILLNNLKRKESQNEIKLNNSDIDINEKIIKNFRNEITQKIKCMKRFFTNEKRYKKINRNIVIKNTFFQIENIKEKYNSFILELKHIIINDLDLIISDFNLDFYNKFCDYLKYNPKYQINFPYEKCVKEFILYSYLNEFTYSNFSELMFNLMNKNELKFNDIIIFFDEFKKELVNIKNNQDKIHNFIFIEKSFNSMNISIIFFQIFILCSNYFDHLQNKISDFFLSVLKLDKNYFFITYKQFYEYYYYFKCNYLVSNKDKFLFVEKVLNNLKTDFDLNVKIKELFGINEKIENIINEFNKTKKMKNINNIDFIYTNIINYFTYQH